MSGVAAVQARIGAIEARMASFASASLPSASLPSSREVNSVTGSALGSGSSAAAAGTSAAFEAALSSAMGVGAPAAASGLSTSQLLGSFAGAQAGTGGAFVASAAKYLGVPYVWGGESAAGMDCSGLIQRAFADLGVSVPRTAREQMKVGTAVPSLAQAQPGDLIVTRGGGHIAIYLGDNKILHAPQPGEKVSVRELFETDADIDTIRRVLPAGGAASPVSSPAGVSAAALAALTGGGLGMPGATGISGAATGISGATGIAGAALDPARFALQLSTGALS